MDFYLKISDTERVLVGSIDCDAMDEVYFSPDNSCELSGYTKLVSGRNLSAIPYRYRKMSTTLNLRGRQIALAVPRDILQKHIAVCIDDIETILNDTENSEYLVTYIANKRFLDNLNRAKVNLPMLRKVIAATTNPTTLKTLSSLLPNSDGYCDSITYDTSGTSTGRLTVTGGPNILTVPVAARRCLSSDYSDGMVLQIDIVSAEPKFALHVKGDDPPVDVYAHIATTILGGAVERHHAKLITLCALYGQSPKKLKRKLPVGVDVRKVISQTKAYFGTSELVRRLKRQHDNGELRNAVGRPLFVESSSDHLLISHFLQSSVAECAILMFRQFVEEHKDSCKPLFVVHDALLVDTHPLLAKKLLDKKNVKLQLGNWIFDATIKKVEDS